MTFEEQQDYKHYLEKAMAALDDCRVEWIALSVKFTDGASIAVHSKDAPKRPKGVSSG